LDIDQQSYHWDLGKASIYTHETFEKSLSWRAWHPTPGPRQHLYTKLWELLHPLEPQVIDGILEKILAWADLSPAARHTHRVLTWREAADLKEDPWIKFGSHGVTHASLASLPLESQARELLQSKTSLEAVSGRCITTLAYPYGKEQDYSIQTAALAREAGYKIALINSSGVFHQHVDPFYLPRCFVEDWEKEEFTRKLGQWMEE
jgi:hypothetical protein